MLGEYTSSKDPKSMAQYNSGLKHDSLPGLKKLLTINSSVHIICGSLDRIFPAAEIRQGLKAADIEIDVVTVNNIPHSPLASKKGIRLLQKALEVLDA